MQPGYTVADIISWVQSKLNDPSFAPADIIEYVNKGNKRIHNLYQLRYMERKQSYTTSSGVQLLGTLPSDLQLALNLRRTDLAYAGKMQWITADKFDERYPQPTITAPSIPMVCYDFDNQIYLFPYPNQPSNLTGYGMELRYLKTPTAIVASTQTPDVPWEFSEYLFLDAFAQAMEKRTRFDVAQAMQQQRDQIGLQLAQRYASGGMQDADAYVIDSPLITG